MKVVKGLLFVHPSMGLGIVTSVSGSNASVTFEEYPGKSYLITTSFIKTAYSSIAVLDRVKSVRDIIRKDLLDGFFNAATKNKGHAIYESGSAVAITSETDQLITANVVGTYIYDVKISYIDGVVSMFCDCPVNGYCKHLFALTEYVKHNKADVVSPAGIKQLEYEVDEKIENLFVKETHYSFEFLDQINEEIKEITNNIDLGKIFEYFANHKEVGANTNLLCYQIFYICNDLYEKTIVYLTLHPEFRSKSSFLKSLSKNRELLMDYFNDRYYYASDILKKREMMLLYSCINDELGEINALLANPTFNDNTKIAIAYYLEKIFLVSYESYKNYIKPLLRDYLDLVYQAYQRTSNQSLQKVLYLDFINYFNSLGIKRNDISSIDVLLQMVDKNEKINTNKKRREIFELAKSCIKDGYDKEVVAIVFTDWLENYRHPIFDELMRKELIELVKDNELLIKIISAKRRGYDYY